MSKLLKSGTAGGRLQRSNIRKMGTGGTGRSTCSGCCPDYIYSDPTGMALQDFCTSIGGSSDPSTHWTNCLLFPFCQWITDPAHPPAGWCSYNGQYQDINCTWFTDEQCNVAENWMTSGGGSGNGAGWCYWSDYPGDEDWYGPCPPHTNCPSGQQWNEASCSCIDAFQATQGSRRGAGISSRRKKMRRGTYLSPFGRIKVSQNQYPVNDGGYCMNFDDGDGWNEYDCTCPGDGYCNCISTGNNCQPCHGGYSGACPSAPIT